MSKELGTQSDEGTYPVRGVGLALVAAGVLLLLVPFLIAGISSRNGYSSCGEYEPASMAFSDTVVQTKHRVTLFPLVLECSYTTEIQPDSPDYVIVKHDLGTGWWVGAPASFLAAATLLVASRNRATRIVATSRESIRKMRR